MDRIVILVDMDCFYVQVEQRCNPDLKGKPAAVVQYNSWKGGGIIAVSYEARAFGVTRQMRGDEAREKCPDIQLVRVPEKRGKADLTRYREAGAEVITVLSKYSDSVERASVDEAYVDVTDQVQQRLAQMEDQDLVLDPAQLGQTFIAGRDMAQEGVDIEDVRKEGLKAWLSSGDMETKRLGVGALIAEEMRAAVLKDTGFKCSAGISHNKMLAKIACGFHKPNRQSVLPPDGLEKVFKTVPFRKFRNLGGKLGHSITQDLGVEYMGDLLRYEEKQLQKRYGEKTGSWLYGICRGIDDEPVRPRQLAKSTGCSKNFTGKNALDTKDKVKYWMRSLAEEVESRLQREEELNNRTAKLLTVYVRQAGNPPTSASRSCGVHVIKSELIAKNCLTVIQNLNHAGNQQAAWSPAIICLGISASKFTESGSSKTGNTSIQSFLTSAPIKPVTAAPNKDQEAKPEKVDDQKTRRRTLDGFFTQRTKDFKEIAEQHSVDQSPGDLQERKNSKPKDQGIRAFFTQRMNDGTECGSTDSSAKSTSSPTSAVATDDSMTTESLSRVSQNGQGNDRSSQAGGGQGRSFFARLQQKKDRENQAKLERTMRLCHPDTSCSTSHQPESSNTIENECNALQQVEERVENADGDSDLFPEMSSDDDFDEPKGPSSKGKNMNGSCLDREHEGGKVDRDLTKSQGQYCGSDSVGDTAVPSRVPNEDEILCEKCKEIISVWSYPEHLDFHVALELQEQDRVEARPPGPRLGPGQGKPKPGSTIKIGKKRGRPTGSSTKNKKVKQDGDGQGSGSGNSSLHSFFKPK